VGALIAVALLLVGQSAVATQSSYQITALQQEQGRLTAEGQQLQVQLAQARAPKQVLGTAAAKGFVVPRCCNYLAQTQSPIALVSRAPETRPSLWTGVVAALTSIAGRPIDAEATTR